MVMNNVEDPLPWLKDYLSSYRDKRLADPNAQMEAQWVATAWLAPWEHARLRACFVFCSGAASPNARHSEKAIAGVFCVVSLSDGAYLWISGMWPWRRVGMLKLALRWYQADNGKPAETLDELIPKYLSSIPIDPFDPQEKPLQYRLSRGEEIEWPYKSMPSGGSMSPPRVVEPPPFNGAWPAPAAEVKVPAGQGILWSVGPDKIDDGGHRQVGGYDGIPLNHLDTIYDKQDLIYLVPLPATGK